MITESVGVLFFDPKLNNADRDHGKLHVLPANMSGPADFLMFPLLTDKLNIVGKEKKKYQTLLLVYHLSLFCLIRVFLLGFSKSQVFGCGKHTASHRRMSDHFS